jgi:hypothetical protein
MLSKKEKNLHNIGGRCLKPEAKNIPIKSFHISSECKNLLATLKSTTYVFRRWFFILREVFIISYPKT